MVFGIIYRMNRVEYQINDRMSFMRILPTRIEYHLILPGKVFLTNSDWNYSDTLIWEINAIRLYASEDYILTAESRKTNIWAFVLTFLVGIGMLTFCVRQKR